MAIVHFIENGADTSNIPEDSELKAMEGMLQELSVQQLKNGNHVISRSNGELFIPKCERERILDLLHTTHLAEQMMLRQGGLLDNNR